MFSFRIANFKRGSPLICDCKINKKKRCQKEMSISFSVLFREKTFNGLIINAIFNSEFFVCLSLPVDK